MQNLILNAAIHGFKGRTQGNIDISATQPDDFLVTITVADNGVGIPVELDGKIFDPFVTTNRGGGSTGLGLHLVHQWTTKQLKGSIDLNNTLTGGLTVSVTFPRIINPPPEQADCTDETDIDTTNGS